MERRNHSAAETTASAAPSLITTGTGTASYFAELDRIDREAARLNAVSAGDAEWSRWEEAMNRVYGEIERLPLTPENAKIKARAVWSIVGGDLEEINEGQSATCRLLRQIVAGLVADGRI